MIMIEIWKGCVIMALPKEHIFTIDDIMSLPDGKRAELVDGKIYDMAPPSRIHQRIIAELCTVINNYIKKNNGVCEVDIAPFAVYLDKDDMTYVEPDISVICDKDKLSDKGCNGAPDWVVEVVSPSSQQMDYSIKLFKYRNAGVREYWIINPMRNSVLVYDFEKEMHTSQYCFEDEISVCIYPDLSISIRSLLDF